MSTLWVSIEPGSDETRLMVTSARTGAALRARLPPVPRRSFARVAAGGCPPAAPTDPDVQNSRIRLFGTRIRYAGE